MRLTQTLCIASAGKEQPSAERAPRVNPNTNVSIRKQLAIARYLNSPAPEPKEALKTKFRRKKPNEDEQNEAAEKERVELAKLAKKPHLPGLRSLYGSKGAVNPPIVLVDGYNVMLQWVARVKQGHSLHGLPHLLPAGKTLDAIDEPLGFQQMRNRLLVELSQYSAWRDVKVMCAFDAVNNPFCAETKREMQSGIEVIYTSDSDADRFLMAEAKFLRALGASKVLVASNDKEVAAACTGNEIFPIGALTLLKDMRKTENESDWRSLQVNQESKSNLGEAIYTPKNSVFKKVGYKPYARW